jgi:hypothetical protein
LALARDCSALIASAEAERHGLLRQGCKAFPIACLGEE